MGTVTYPNQGVIDFVTTHFIPIKIDNTKEPKRFEEFNAQWTPTILIVDEEKKEHHRTTGYLSPADFMSEMELGLAKLEYHAKHYDKAMTVYRQVLESYPDTSAAPEALYFSGVCHYMSTQDPVYLKETFTELKEKYPGSDWTKKAEVWS